MIVSLEWILPIFALVLGVIVFAFGITAYIQEQQETGTSQPISSIADKNGFSGTIDSDGVATFHTTTSAPGIVMSNGSGQMELALPQTVTNTRLTGFQSSQFSGDSIVPSDTLFTAFQKTLTLNGTPLTGFQPFVGTVNGNDTIFSALQKFQGNLSNQNPYLFCMIDPTMISANNILQDAWTTTNLQGSLILPSDVVSVGSAFFFRCFGSITIGTTNPSLFLFRFFVDNQPVNDVASTVNFFTTGTWNFLWEMVMNVQVGNVITLQGTITLTTGGNFNEFSASTLSQNVGFDITDPHSFFLQASLHGGALNQILVTAAVGNMTCNL
jgi:hypothetical protein